MPELPDVEGFRRVLDRAVGVRLDHLDVLDAGVLRGVSPPEIERELADRCFARPWRRGKWLVAPVRSKGRKHRHDDASVVFHFGMTGGLRWSDPRSEPREPYDRVVFVTDEGELRYRDLRKLQGIRHVRGDREVEDLLHSLGPDACEVSARDLRDRLTATRRQLKPALMDQSMIAGLGNLLVDEILWRAFLHPTRSTGMLSRADCARLHRRMRAVLRHAMGDGLVPGHPSWLTGNRAEEGQPCPRCGTPLRHSRVGGRTTVWCPHCQAR